MYINNDEQIDPMEQMKNYKARGSYNSAIGDIIIPMMSDMLQIRIVILKGVGNDYVLQNREHIFGKKDQDTVYFRQKRQHYDALIEKRVRPKRVAKPSLKVQENENIEEKGKSGDARNKNKPQSQGNEDNEEKSKNQ